MEIRIKDEQDIDKQIVRQPDLGNISSPWMESLGDMSDFEEKEKEEINIKIVNIKPRNPIETQNLSFEDDLSKNTV